MLLQAIIIWMSFRIWGVLSDYLCMSMAVCYGFSLYYALVMCIVYWESKKMQKCGVHNH